MFIKTVVWQLLKFFFSVLKEVITTKIATIRSDKYKTTLESLIITKKKIVYENTCKILFTITL